MKSLLDHLKEASQTLKEAGCETPQLDAEVLLSHTLQCERHELYLADRQNQKISAVFQKYIERRKKQEPVAYIVGYKEFWSLTIKVTPDVLIPRPETEELVERGLKLVKGKEIPRILDLCCGSGAMAAAFAKELPHAEIVATDISEKAIEIAAANLLFASSRITLLQSDLFEKIKGKFDLIVSNPPYIPTEIIPNLNPDIAEYEPLLALDGGREGLDFIDRIGQDAPRFLKDDGWLLLENGAKGFKVQQWNRLSLKGAFPSTVLSR